MKVVIDTNIFISALLSQNGFAIDVLQLALQKKIEPQFGEKLFLEYEDVLSRKQIIEASKLNELDIEALFDALLSVSTWNEVYYLWRPNLDDEGDNHILELAVSSNAKYIITHNKKDFVQAELKFDINILTAEEFMRKEIL